MFCKLFLSLVIVAIASGNPAANTEWRWVPKTLKLNPIGKALPFIPIEEPVHTPQQRPRRPFERVRVDNCGTVPLASPNDGRIVGGEEASPHEFPWQTAVFINGNSFCGGSVISEEFILTAGHCIHNANTVTVVLGAHNISASEDSQVTFDCDEFFTHENFSMVTAHHDIALVRLPEKVIFNEYIQPVCLPTSPDLADKVLVTPSGWGKTSDATNTIADVVHKVDVLTVTNQACEDYYGSFSVTENLICINGTGGHGTCNGDSGGPLNYINGVTETRGITSFGSNDGCESGAPAAFTRVSHYLDWIEINSGVTGA